MIYGTLKESRLKEALERALNLNRSTKVSVQIKKAPLEEGFVDFLFINATVAGMIEAELNKILFGDMENNQNNEDVKS